MAAVAVVAAIGLLAALGSRVANRRGAGASSPEASTTSALPLEYPPGSTEQFLEFCVGQGASRRVCTCAVEELNDEMTYPQFVAFELRLYSDPDARPPEDVIATFERCATRR